MSTKKSYLIGKSGLYERNNQTEYYGDK